MEQEKIESYFQQIGTMGKKLQDLAVENQKAIAILEMLFINLQEELKLTPSLNGKEK